MAPQRDMRDAIAARVATFVKRGEGNFDSLACAIFEHQRANNPSLSRMFAGASPSTAIEIPAVPVDLFKTLDLGPQPALPTDCVFRTSGTTTQVRGVVRCRDTLLYDMASAVHFAKMVPEPPGHWLSICPSDPDSSLGHMVARLSGGEVDAAFGVDGVDPKAWERLRDPCVLASTAFALDALFAMPGVVSLTEESVVMVTGGFKGRDVRLDQEALYAALPARLGAPRVVGEYGMSELSSQLWTHPVPAGAPLRAFVAPPWLRVLAVDPASGQPVQGEGILRFFDLCNLDSPVAVETADLGLVEAHPEGDRVWLRGRLTGSEARGCSLRAEQFLRQSLSG